ncbi:MAG: cysteine peptidase family C39 domain-containing protein [Chloroflexi bacterium]|nr:cysteine peptidase family C39 domain-containing protein [Chloroflexota bacterium]MCI0576026.1 cysteine peptidase family C39 domain-containing protein [Chloroflexota bacterium]MCI0645150.1 cysteine peptidase family C39 domain-containing protein [Chloroflexota bacterium]MCI0725630.1 cysteine peptidase family C39 domain-containing protein [Chloroflexota bacterium]
METPIVIQFDGTECGPAALGIVLGYYGYAVPLEELCAVCEVEQYGSRASHLLAAARHYGFEARAFRQTATAVRAAKTPFIAYWQEDHFVVVEKFEPGRVFINDPAYGRRVVDEEEFDQAFSNVVLLLEPGPATGQTPPGRPAPDNGDPLLPALQAGIQGAVGWLPRQTAHYDHDFSRLYRRRPRLVVKAIGEQDVIHTLQIARQAGIPVATRGAGHARNGQPLSEGGIVLVNYLDAPVAQYRLLDGGQVEVTARTRWGAVEQELHRLGRSMPTLPAYGNLSVGGTLSVGGYGERSIHYGAQIHHVRRLRLITPDGTPLWCSPEENAELFRYSLAGLGQVGVIEKVVMQTIPYQALDEPVYYRHPTLANFLNTVASLTEPAAARPPHFAAFAIKDQGIFSEYRYPAGEAGLPPAEAQPVSARPAFRGQDTQEVGFRLAADYLFDFHGLSAYLQFLEALWYTTPLGRYTDWALILAVRSGQSAVDFPLEAAPAGNPPFAFLAGFYPLVPPEDGGGLKTVRGILRQTLARCLELGGRPYLYGSHELDEATRLALYGDGYRRLIELRQELDPQQLFNAHSL